MTDQQVVAVFGSSRIGPGSADWDSAERLGGKLAELGLAVITGGYGGTMEATSKGAAEAGGHVIGVIAPSLFPDRPGANRYVAEVIEASGLLARIGTLVDRADGVIALPGSIGTATELFVAWNHNYIARHNGWPPLPTVAVGEAWRELAATMMGTAGAEPGDVHIVESGEDGLEWLLGVL